MDRRTYPTSFTMQLPGFYDYKSTQVAAYVQDEWQLRPRLHVNAGLRYDADTNMRINGFYSDLLKDPFYAPLARFRGNADAGMDLDTLQPRLGATFDVSGTGSLVLRGGWGRYVTRNRPWFETRTMNQTTSSSVFITDPNAMKFFPDINGVLGGKTLSQFAATAATNIGTLISDHFKLPSSLNSTVGFGWQINRVTSLDVDYVNALGRDQIGLVDLNLPASGAVNAANPRPVPQFAQVLSMENYVTSTYNALQMQLRTRVRGANSLQVSYTFSKQRIDGVDFFSTLRGTQRTPLRHARDQGVPVRRSSSDGSVPRDVQPDEPREPVRVQREHEHDLVPHPELGASRPPDSVGPAVFVLVGVGVGVGGSYVAHPSRDNGRCHGRLARQRARGSRADA
ncbi:MAG: hypothetical protein DMG04_02085 [Acidobacteria bacterium]|nr:MAG: hypothetical protein DMG04_02085 [Acidobacteriota bacterium]